MPLRLYDSRARALTDFSLGPTVGVYVCGITPYDSTHLGHAFTYTAFDVLTRWLQHCGHQVRSVRNITDVDDDILRKARELGVDYLDLARREVARFHRDMAAVGVPPPDAEPRATDTVPAILDAVGRLVAGRHAYALADGRVYFDVAASGRFGELSGLDREAMLAEFAAKGGDPDAPGKRDPLDFLLWQPSAAGEPAWDSAWGPGRPGWHIECSVMAMSELGSTVDVHGGGRDLVFPHHSAELVQSEALTGRPFARLWSHAGMVGLEGAKMSKSLGNLVFVTDLLERYEGAALRRYLLSHHYRADWSFDESALAEAASGYKRWCDAAGEQGRRPDLAGEFATALDDDLDTPAALQVVDAAAEAGAGQEVRLLAGTLGFDLG